ncbi:MAG TPA: hypothetical protein VM820_01490 [Vicinamibacterales bacterium]|nr:hypothetical protein [Vicinamibacterales bacterium]
MDEWTEERYPGVTRAELERERTARPLRRHAFVSSGKQAFGRRICTCGSLERDSIHRVPEVTEEQRAADARRVGERDGA